MREVLKRLEAERPEDGKKAREWLKKTRRNLKKYCCAVECQHGQECDICELGETIREISEVLKA